MKMGISQKSKAVDGEHNKAGIKLKTLFTMTIDVQVL